MKLYELQSAAASKQKILIINFSEPSKQKILSGFLPNATFATWQQLSISNGDILVNNESLSGYDKILIGAMGRAGIFNSSLENYCKKNKVKTIFYGRSTETANKPLHTVLMNEDNIRQIKTVIAYKENTNAKDLISKLKLPVISKIVNGSKGRGILKHDSEKDLEKFLSKKDENPFIFQEFIPNDGDIRAFFLFNKLVYAIKRVSSDSKEFRNNTSLGGSSESIELSGDALDLATKVDKCVGFDIAGIDLIQHKVSKKWYVMEINAAPQINEHKTESTLKVIADYLKNL